jgi:membrane protein DedA with SNARE-associated domain
VSVDQIAQLFVLYGYWIVFAAIVFDNAGLPIPGELLLIALGGFARAGQFDPVVAIAVGATAAMAGDSLGYSLGRLTGTRVLHTYCRATLGSVACIDRITGYYARYGLATVAFGRFVVGVRAFLAPLAGSARMPYLRFLLFDTIGALLWSTLFVLAGYHLGAHVARVHEGLRAAVLVAVGLLVLGFLAYRVVRVVGRARSRPSPGTAPGAHTAPTSW